MNSIEGSLSIIGDKSISHRTIILGSLAEGVSKIKNVLLSGDTLSTIKIFRQMGVNIKNPTENYIEIDGVGLKGLQKPSEPLNALNSGTTARLLTGILSKQKFESTLEGSDQLRQRPMERIVRPLCENGANIKDSKGKLPLFFTPSDFAFEYIHSSKPSAQVKSGLLLASLYHENFQTTVTEEIPTRDHTERMLSLMGVTLVRMGNSVTVEPKSKLQNIDYYVPGDPSSAAFLIAIGVLKSKELNIKNVLLNERRIGFLKILKKMNADLIVKDVEVQNNENVGTIVVKKSNLKGVTVNSKDVADMVDEFPVFTLLASQADGNTVVEGVQELRLKESDRIMAMENFIINLGGQINTSSNGFQIAGIQKLQGGTIKTEDDHRIAMTGVVANLCINSEIKIDNIDCISDSYPSFFSDLEKVGAKYVD
tara:strand:+ start:1869 stop:3140 length:1272 start_codon:yes stop_codon:yes gene_type:complete